jgi:hypothetical protein
MQDLAISRCELENVSGSPNFTHVICMRIYIQDPALVIATEELDHLETDFVAGTFETTVIQLFTRHGWNSGNKFALNNVCLRLTSCYFIIRFSVHHRRMLTALYFT